MVERGEQARLARESGEPIGVRGEPGRQQLERDVAAEPRVVRAVDLAHAAAAEQRLQVIDTDVPSDPGRFGSFGGRRPGCRRQCRLFEEARHRGLVEERLHVASKRLVARAGFRQKRGTFCGRALERAVVEPLDQSPAL